MGCGRVGCDGARWFRGAKCVAAAACRDAVRPPAIEWLRSPSQRQPMGSAPKGCRPCHQGAVGSARLGSKPTPPAVGSVTSLPPHPHPSRPLPLCPRAADATTRRPGCRPGCKARAADEIPYCCRLYCCRLYRCRLYRCRLESRPSVGSTLGSTSPRAAIPRSPPGRPPAHPLARRGCTAAAANAFGCGLRCEFSAQRCKADIRPSAAGGCTAAAAHADGSCGCDPRGAPEAASILGSHERGGEPGSHE